MLVLLTVPSVGIAVAASKSLSGTQRPAESEEVEERASCNAQRRIQVDRAMVQLASVRRVPVSAFGNPAELQLRPSVAGHRFSNGFLAPMRC